ncbi:hypothetical protein CAAN1_04S00144 [[Candida] anglica]|uniref:Uncharacterized protein n=1 Tax=[Candida] anglica TaxID=148631 RepID=A0ABP0EDN6_9ASCO
MAQGRDGPDGPPRRKLTPGKPRFWPWGGSAVSTEAFKISIFSFYFCHYLFFDSFGIGLFIRLCRRNEKGREERKRREEFLGHFLDNSISNVTAEVGVGE